jgi:hypothetical protein
MRKTILIILVVICSIALHAQDSTFNRVVTVERDYQPDIEQATKIKLRPAVLTKEVEPNPVIYSTYSTPLSVEYNLHPLQAAKVSFVPQPILNGVIEGAVGHRNTHLLFGYRINHKKKMSLDLYANHDAYWGKDALSNSKLGMQVNRHFSGADLYLGVEGANEYFSYYGRNFDGGIIATNTPIPNQSLWNVNAKIGLRSTNDNAVQYRIQTGYNAFIVPNYTIEHQVRSFLDVAWSNDNHGAGVHVFVQNSLRNDTTGWNRHALRVEPFYSFKNQHIRLHVGVNIDLNIGTGQQLSTMENIAFAPSPNIKFEWNMMDNIFHLYADAKGAMGIGSLDEYLSYNRYLNIQEGIRFQSPRAYTPVDAQLGFKIRPIKTMLLDIYGGYAYMLNACHMMAHVDAANPYAAQDFILQLANYQRWKVGASLHYHYRDIIELNASGNYYIWKAADGVTVYDRPSWDAHARLDVHIDSKWSVYSDNYFAGGYKVATTIGDKDLRPTISLNVGGQYSVNNWLHVYLQLNNYLNRKNDIFYGYQSQGCHFLLGVKYKF